MYIFRDKIKNILVYKLCTQVQLSNYEHLVILKTCFLTAFVTFLHGNNLYNDYYNSCTLVKTSTSRRIFFSKTAMTLLDMCMFDCMLCRQNLCFVLKYKNQQRLSDMFLAFCLSSSFKWYI